MSITDDQYSDWLADDNAERVILAEISYRDVAAGTDGVLYIASMPFISAATDTPAVQLYDDLILEIPEITRRLPEQLFGQASVSYGDLRVSNVDGEIDAWFDYAFESHAIHLYIGDPTWAKADFRTIFVGTVDKALATEEDVISIQLRDNTWYLNVPVLTSVIGGDGPRAGEQEPICIGGCFNVEAILYAKATQTYKLSKGPIYDVVDVRDNGASLASNFTAVTWVHATDLFTWVAHGMPVNTRIRFSNATLTNVQNNIDYWVISSGLTADNFKISQTQGGAVFDTTGTFATGGATAQSFKWNNDLANGRITLVSSPAGRVTADVKGIVSTDSPTEWVSSIADAIRYLVTNYTSLPLEFLDSAALYADDFAAFATPTIGLRVQGGETVAELIAELVSTAFAFYSFDRDGVLALGRVFSPEGGDITQVAVPTPVLTLTDDDVDEDAGITQIRQDNVLGVLESGFFRNWTPMADGVAAAVPSYAASLLRGEYVFEGASGGIAITIPPDSHSGTVLEVYPFAERAQHLTLLSATTWAPMTAEGGVSTIPSTQAQEWRNYWLWLRRKPRTTYRLPVNATPFALNLGDVVALAYPRMGFEDTANAIVVGILEQPDDGSAVLELWK